MQQDKPYCTLQLVGQGTRKISSLKQSISKLLRTKFKAAMVAVSTGSSLDTEMFGMKSDVVEQLKICPHAVAIYVQPLLDATYLCFQWYIVTNMHMCIHALDS